MMFTDIENSTSRWESSPVGMRQAMNHHDKIVWGEIERNGGRVFKNTGDGVGAIFEHAPDAGTAAIAIQHRMQTDPWDGFERLKVRIGLHIGHITPTRGDYYGPPVNRAVRICDIANGDQIAISGVVSRFLSGFERRSMGHHQLRGIGTESIDLLTASHLVADRRPLRARATMSTRSSQPVDLVGRTHELDRVFAVVTGSPLVTIVGPTGMGKSSLSAAVAFQAMGYFDDGFALCELSAVRNQEAVVDVLAEAVGARLQSGMTLSESLLDYLHGRNKLLVLQNAGYVLDELQPILHELCAIEGVSVLATSEHPLGLEGERTYRLGPLGIDSAIELYSTRAKKRDPSLGTGLSDWDDLQVICEELGRQPFALELVAARERKYGISVLRERIELAAAERPNRTHGDVVEWCSRQFNAAQRQLLQRLSVFRGSFSLDAVSSVCTDDDLVRADSVLDLLMSLVDAAFVKSQRGAGHIRFSMHPSILEFASQRLDESGGYETYRNRHASYFHLFAQEQSALLVSTSEADVWERLDREWPNFRAAVRYSIGRYELDQAAGIITHLGWFATLSLRSELFAWAGELAEEDKFDSLSTRAAVLGLCSIGNRVTLASKGLPEARLGLELDPDEPFGFCRFAIGSNALDNTHEGEPVSEQTVEWLASLDDDSHVMSRIWAHALRVSYLCSHALGPEASQYVLELKRIADSTGSASAMAIARWASGLAGSYESVDVALVEWGRGKDIARSLHDVHLVAQMCTGLELNYTAARGSLDLVLNRCLEAISEAYEHHYLLGTSQVVGSTLIVLSRVGRADVAAQLLGSMAVNGYVPRTNAMDTVEMGLGEETEGYRALGATLSTSAAAKLAKTALSEAIENRGETT